DFGIAHHRGQRGAGDLGVAGREVEDLAAADRHHLPDGALSLRDRLPVRDGDDRLPGGGAVAAVSVAGAGDRLGGRLRARVLYSGCAGGRAPAVGLNPTLSQVLTPR